MKRHNADLLRCLKAPTACAAIGGAFLLVGVLQGSMWSLPWASGLLLIILGCIGFALCIRCRWSSVSSDTILVFSQSSQHAIDSVVVDVARSVLAHGPAVRATSTLGRDLWLDDEELAFAVEEIAAKSGRIPVVTGLPELTLESTFEDLVVYVSACLEVGTAS